MSSHLLTPLTHRHAIIGGFTLLVLLFLGRRRSLRQTVPHPPGPRPLPLIGNILDMPQSKFALTWTKFGEEYGPLTFLTIPGQKILVINSFEAAEELLGKRSSIFIDRPRFTMTNELLGISKHLALSVANEMWKRQRSHLRHALAGTVVKSVYSSLLETKARQYLERCAARPENILPETTRIIGEAIIEVTYGKLEDDQGRDYIQIATRLLDILIFSLQGYVVDMFPALQYLPKWLPGMKFKRDAARWRNEMAELEDAIFGLATANMLSDDPKVQSSFMFKRIQDLDNNHEEGSDILHLRDDINYCGLQVFFGGLETSEATMQTFIRAMTLFPSVQKKAHAEIDSVIGPSRLPTFKDQPNLPYLHAVVLETLRWSPVVSIGVPRVSRNDDIYDGYFIPKGTTVIANAWGFSRNSKYYTNPSTFDPERFLKQPPELDPREFTFGYGRRLCPGQDLALQKIWIMVASVLWAFKLVGTEDEPVSLSEVDLFSFGMANRPMPFKCQLFPRREDLIDKLAEASG